MSEVETFSKIRETWIQEVSEQLAHEQEVRDSFKSQLEYLFDDLLVSLEEKDPSKIEPIIDQWFSASTLDVPSEKKTTISRMIQEITFCTFRILPNNLELMEVVALVNLLAPILIHAFEYATRREAKMSFERVLDELNTTKKTLERLDRSKSDFIAIAAHELKTPLTLIEGYATMLAEGIHDRTEHSPDNTSALLGGIKNGTRRLREIVDDMIDVSMIDNNLLDLNFQPVWLNRLITIVHEEFKSALIERDINFMAQDFPGSREMTFADPERLLQAFRHILSNAIKFTPNGGSICIDGRILPGYIEVTVSDTGVGIDPQNYELIFEKFGRIGSVSLHSSGKTKFKGGGPGLGLPITKGIIEAHGGTIWVESDGFDENRNPGAKFHLLIPIRKIPPDEKIARLFQVTRDENAVDSDTTHSNSDHLVVGAQS